MVLSSYLCQRCPRVLDVDFAIVCYCCPDGDCFAGDVPAAVESHAAQDGALGPAGQANLVLNLAVKRLLKEKKKKVLIQGSV
jgi:hypothetical protein